MKKINLGILGGGQLGSMLCMAAKKLNIYTIVWSDDPTSPAKEFSNEFIFSSYSDNEQLNHFTEKVDKITFEFENIHFDILDKLNSIKEVLPKPKVNKIIQNRILEKDFVNNQNIKTTEYKKISNKDDLISNVNFLPAMLKTTTLGYDGKGQFKLNNLEDCKRISLSKNTDYILEKMVNLKKEISVIITRFKKNEFEIYEPFENKHEDQILRVSKIPANISKEHFFQSIEFTKKISEKLDYIGTLCVEFFIDDKDNLLVNEIAPRVHNSGHMTINSHNISQFENHIRAVCGLEKVKTLKLYNAEMINILGKEIIKFKEKKLQDNEFFFDYLKKEIREKRKMGHFTEIKKISD
tara:strand:+ start:250 stop:1305 length:1056 start_codon:yes stop_codon:yes gene_type:complete